MKKQITSWDDVTVKMAEHIDGIYAQTHKHHLRRTMEVYAYVMGDEADRLMSLPTDECDKLRKPYSFLDTPRQLSEKRPATWNGFKITYDVRKSTAGQFIDNDSLSSMSGVTASQRLAVLMTRDDMDFEQRANYIYNHCPITIAEGVMSFFLTRTNLLLRLSLRFSAFLLRLKSRRLKWMLRKARLRRTLSGLFGLRRL